MHEGKTVSVILPAYNEASGIAQAVGEFKSTGVVDEVLVVDNNSTDGTGQIAKTAGAKVVQETVQGYGAALIRGLKESKTDWVILAEPDGTFVASDVLKLLGYAGEFDLVLGTRTTKEMIWDGANMGWCLRNVNTWVAKFMELLHNTPSLSDCGCTMRLIRREGLAKILPYLSVTGSHFLPEMVLLSKKFGLKMVEIPVNYRKRKGTSKITGSFPKTAQTALNMIALIIRYRLTRIHANHNGS